MATDPASPPRRERLDPRPRPGTGTDPDPGTSVESVEAVATDRLNRLEPAAPGPQPENETEPETENETGGPFPLRVQAAWDETPSLRGVRLAVPAALSAAYTVPGQYLEVRHPRHGTGYFALTAAPQRQPVLELLVRRGSELADTVAALPPGAPCDFTAVAVRGAGFAVFRTEHPPRDLLLVAAGSGIAPLRAALQLVFGARARFGRVALFYGQRQEADLAYRRELEALTAGPGGLELSLVLSRPPADWTFGSGRVQDQLHRAPPPWLGPETTVLLCGMGEMIAAVTQVLREKHALPAEQILLNY